MFQPIGCKKLEEIVSVNWLHNLNVSLLSDLCVLSMVYHFDHISSYSKDLEWIKKNIYHLPRIWQIPYGLHLSFSAYNLT